MENIKELPKRRSSPEHGDYPEDTPWIYVTSVADFSVNVRHSAWIRADQPPDKMQDQLDAFLAASPAARSGTPEATGWFIEDTLGFYGHGPYLTTDVAHITNIGQGIDLHGEAFAAYAMEHANASCEELLTEFEEFYVATFPDAEACIDEFLKAMGWSQALEALVAEQGIDCPLDFDRSCIWERYKEAWEVIEGRNGTIYVFNT
ncbi:antirestriction protein ArdA [Arthrobacter sp. 2MCAF14]|uniref:antirestriction protein ArdA n=1 Tax=Arthrobacter sp. 2MCAF14 TaxID=3232982 RepID=UPI003F8E2B97